MSIHSNVYNIVQVLSEDGDLHVPWFQRDYTWDEDNINELFLIFLKNIRGLTLSVQPEIRHLFVIIF